MSTCTRWSPRPPGRICKAQPLLEPGPSSSFASIGGEAAFDNLVDLLPSSSPLDAPEAVDANQPTLIHNAAARGWSERRVFSDCFQQLREFEAERERAMMLRKIDMYT